MRKVYQLNVLGKIEGYYSSVEKACRRIWQSGYTSNKKPFHTTVKKEVKEKEFFKNEVFEIIQHPLN